MNVASKPSSPLTSAISLKKPQQAIILSGQKILHMYLHDLPMYDSCIDHAMTVGETARLFEQHQHWHGVIIIDQEKFVGIVTRQRCFEMLGRLYGIEIFAKMTIGDFFYTYSGSNLLLHESIPIQEGVRQALGRDDNIIYDPIGIEKEDGSYAMINMQVLLLAQYELMEHLYSEVQILSTQDPLTKLNNRRGFFEEAFNMIKTAKDTQNDLCALMIDIDHFKITNDIYGHFAGDQVIRCVAEISQQSLRPVDLLGRFGGEEFIALLPGVPINLAADFAESIRRNVEEKTIHINGYHINVTVSVGVSHLLEARGSLDNLLSQADQAMYTAKTAGRNMVQRWDPLIACQVKKDVIAPGSDAPHQANWKPGFRTDTARIYDETIEGWAKALEIRDRETEGHAQRVVNLTIALARKCGVDESDMDRIRRGALLHDIGKLAIQDSILFKPEPLTETEWEAMKKHPVYAYEFLSPITFLKESIDIPYCHHEHWDGSGYPRGLRGEEIPLAARIFTIVDVWDALLSDRCYRTSWQTNQTRAFITEQSGKLFDPAITEKFLELLDETNLLFNQADG